MRTTLSILLLLFYSVPTVNAQINVEFQIVGANQTLQESGLNQQLQEQNLSTAVVVSSGISQQVLIQQCSSGSFAEGSTSQCFNCPAGTASAVVGATSGTVCQTCFAGTFAAQKSSTCTGCPVGTFSTTVGAPNITSCTACPANSNSTASSDAVTSCACKDRFFNPVNVLTAIDPPAPVQFSSWQGLAVGILLLDVPHLNC